LAPITDVLKTTNNELNSKLLLLLPVLFTALYIYFSLLFALIQLLLLLFIIFIIINIFLVFVFCLFSTRAQFVIGVWLLTLHLNKNLI
jgi:hypothetical protein